MEAAWAYRHRPYVGETLRKRQEVVSDEIREIAWRAPHRAAYALSEVDGTGKEKGKVVTAIGRELLGNSRGSAEERLNNERHKRNSLCSKHFPGGSVSSGRKAHVTCGV